MNPTDTLLALLAAAGTLAAVLYGLTLFRGAVAWLGFVLGGLWGWTLGGLAVGGTGAALIGAIVGAALLGVLASSAERVMALLLGGFGFWVLALGLGGAAGLGGTPLAIVGLAGGIIGASLVFWLHDLVVAVAVAVWGTGFLRLDELFGGATLAALPRDAWINAPELLVSGGFGHVPRDGPLRTLVLVGFVGVAWQLQRLDFLEARGKAGKLGPRRLRRIGWLCALLSLLPLLSPAMTAAGGARWAAWLHLPWHSLGLGPTTWPAATLLLWLVAGWARRSAWPARLAASLVSGVALLAFGVLVQHLVDGVPLEPLVQDLLHPSGPQDPDVLGALAFALAMFLSPLAPRRRPRP